MVAGIPEVHRKSSPTKTVYVLKPQVALDAEANYDRESFLEGRNKLESDSSYNQFGLKSNRLSISQCSLRIRWTMFACLIAILCISVAVTVLHLAGLLVKQQLKSESEAIREGIEFSSQELPLPNLIAPQGANQLPKLYDDPLESKDFLKWDSDEAMADQPAAAPSTEDRKDCQSVTYGDDANLNCPRAHVLNLTVTSNNGYDSLAGFLAHFPKLKALNLDFQDFCPQPSSPEQDKIALGSLEELTIKNSKPCNNLSSALTFKLPRLVHLHLVNTRLDLELNKQLLGMLEEACKPKPQGTLKYVEIWHSDVCRDCGFEYEECESEPSSGYNYIKYFI